MFKYRYIRYFHSYIHYIGRYVRKFRAQFYISLAIGFILFIAISLILSLANGDINGSTYDFAIQKRLSGPRPNRDILIIDIDEKSIAELSPKIGRWPWTRDILAEVIAGLEDSKPSVIYVNLLLAEEDTRNRNSDNSLGQILKQYTNIVIPWVRLNSKNDLASSFEAKDIPGYESGHTDDKSGTALKGNKVALIPALFSDARNNHGFSNLSEDDDGIIRRFTTKFAVGNGYVDSSALVASEIHLGKNLPDLPKSMFLNWRNKKGGYYRVSFSEVYQQFQGGKAVFQPDELSNKIVVIGLSAPGLANLKGSASSRLIDDNEIIATAIDDMINGTYLKLMPIFIYKLISIILIIMFSVAFISGSYFINLNKSVVIVQSLLAVITIGFISYTNYFVDLSECIALSLSYYGLCKIHQTIDNKATRAVDLFSFSELSSLVNSYTVIIFSSKDVGLRSISKIKRQLENTLGIPNCYLLDNVYDSENMFHKSLNQIFAFVLFTESDTVFKSGKLQLYGNSGEVKNFDFGTEKILHITNHIDRSQTKLNDDAFCKLLAGNFLELSLIYLKEFI